MKKYPKYKPSGIECIGDVPNHWDISKIKYIDLVIMGQSPNSDECNSEGKGLPFLQGNAEFGDLHPTPKLWCENANKQARPNDILLSVRAPVGAVNIANENVGIGRGLCAVRSVKSNTKFLYYYLNFIKDELDSISTGSTFKAINLDDVKNIYIPSINKDEQNQIAKYLEYKINQIETLIANKQKLIELLQEERTAIINHAVSKGINQKAKLKASGVEWLGDVPENWEVKKLKYVCQLISEKATSKPDYILALENIKSWSGEIVGNPYENQMEGDAILFQEGDILFNKLRPYLAKVVKATKNGGCVGELLVLRVREGVSSNFLYHRLRSEMIITIVDGSTYGTKMPRASWDKFISNLCIGLPKFEEQIKICEYIEREEKRIDTIISKTEQEIELMKEYKIALISEVVTGKVDVRDEVIEL
jgi:type I restriction enzyme S subunit